jgi:hypothetical protein
MSNERTFSFDEVTGLLCEGCLMRLPSALERSCNETNWYHTCNGARVPCFASQWRIKVRKVVQAQAQGPVVEKPEPCKDALPGDVVFGRCDKCEATGEIILLFKGKKLCRACAAAATGPRPCDACGGSGWEA